jgi:hypothetical protein
MNARERECYRRWQSYESSVFPAIAKLPIDTGEQKAYVSRLSFGQLRNVVSELRVAASFQEHNDEIEPIIPAYVIGALRRLAGVNRDGFRVAV